jgi:hypothetical protein
MIEEDGGSWLRRPKLYKRVVEPHKKKRIFCHLKQMFSAAALPSFTSYEHTLIQV